MFDVGGGELILIILAILLLFGPEKLPEFTKTITKGMRKVKQAQAQFQNQINDIQSEVNKTLNIEDESPAHSDFKPIPPPDIEIAASDSKDNDIDINDRENEKVENKKNVAADNSNDKK
jgi:TatA/E family protein of Tat protein translocase